MLTSNTTTSINIIANDGFPLKKNKEKYLCAFFSSRKARERELAKMDENRRPVEMLNPLREKNDGMLIPCLLYTSPSPRD